MLATSFDLASEAAGSKTRFLFEFRRHLKERHEAGRLSALVLDEAQSLPYELLEEVRLLSNIETATVKLLNVVLAGQPELATRLNEPGLRQLKQRISLRCEVGALDFPETAAYIAGRLRIAGGDPRYIFSRDSVLAIYEMSGGIPRTINVLCDNALIGGFASQVKPVPRAIVAEVCRDFDMKQDPVAVAAGPAAPPEGDVQPQAARETAGPAAEPPMFAAPARKKRFSFF